MRWKGLELPAKRGIFLKNHKKWGVLFKKVLENPFNAGYHFCGRRCTCWMGGIKLKFYVSATQEKIPPSAVLYMRRTGKYGAGNHALMETFKKWVNENGFCHEDTVIYAIPMDDPKKVEPCRCRYDVCIHRPPGQESVPGPVRCRELAGGNYLVFQIPHTADAVQTAWQMCFSELEELGYLPDENRPVMERYQKRLVDEHFCELCMPIL